MDIIGAWAHIKVIILKKIGLGGYGARGAAISYEVGEGTREIAINKSGFIWEYRKKSGSILQNIR